jgi:hypothetical protein
MAGLRFRPAEIGLGIIASSWLVSLLFLTFNPFGRLIVEWYVSRAISEFTLLALSVAPVSILTVIGLMLYVRDRKYFWYQMSEKGNTSAFLAIIGIIQIIFAVSFALLTYSVLPYLASKPAGGSFSQLLVDYSPYFLASFLVIISGTLLLFDSSEL